MQRHSAGGPATTLCEAAEQLAAAGEAITALMRDAAAPVEPRLSPGGLRVLRVVSVRPGRNLTTVAAAVGLGLPRASRVCAALESAGLLLRRPTAADRREIGLQLSPEGEAFLERFRASRVERMAAVLRRMPTDERGALVAALGELAVAVAAVGSERG
ncbi:MarR family winged helix-turn-helix transcriptional regulator [Streptomyces lydicus]|uniref:MarR family winged helix-turn-helix transcriptional regulator n=1 Tax=Streptomyces lydicus TaxID=47763 RepID=UPI0010127428|nr:MarR family transcriptional regulator [Streptomyces lydicus]MCZ1007164.1 MarR family transcriptional regulator [Streptomyces lydicus]